MKTNFKKSRLLLLPILLLSLFFTSCNNDDDGTISDDTKQGTAQLSKIEIGLNNNEIGTIGEDFHFNMDVLVDDKIDFIQVELKQNPAEKYEGVWSHNEKWDQYNGMKNTNVHKHFDIPADAKEGKYDFVISIHELNGSVTVENRHIRIFHKENLPVSPDLYALNVMVNDDFYFSGLDNYEMPGYAFKTNDVIRTIANISSIKDDGKMYLLLINKKLNHKPETVSAIDFNKAIVYGVYEHKGRAEVGSFVTPFISDANQLIIGKSTEDFNSPTPNPISGAKAWESGSYYFGVVYTNTTHNMSYFKYIDLTVKL